MKAHYQSRSVPGLITRKVIWFRSCLFSRKTTRSFPEESWKMKTSNAVGIQWHSSLQSSQSGPEKRVSTYLGSNKDWTMGGCARAFSPIRSTGFIQGLSIHRAIMHRPLFLFRLQLTLAEASSRFLFGILILRLTDPLKN